MLLFDSSCQLSFETQTPHALASSPAWHAMNVVDASFVVTEPNLSVVSVGIATLHVSQQQHGNLVAQERVTSVHYNPVSVSLL